VGGGRSRVWQAPGAARSQPQFIARRGPAGRARAPLHAAVAAAALAFAVPGWVGSGLAWVWLGLGSTRARAWLGLGWVRRGARLPGCGLALACCAECGVNAGPPPPLAPPSPKGTPAGAGANCGPALRRERLLQARRAHNTRPKQSKTENRYAPASFIASRCCRSASSGSTAASSSTLVEVKGHGTRPAALACSTLAAPGWVGSGLAWVWLGLGSARARAWVRFGVGPSRGPLAWVRAGAGPLR
jgi:hypothetical protein